MDSFNSSSFVTFFPNDLDTQQFFLFFFDEHSKEMHGTPFNSITVRDPKTFVFFLIQLLDIFLS